MSPDATKEFRKLDKTIQKRVAVLVDKVEASVNPRFSGKALKGNDKEWRYRVGDYRLICDQGLGADRLDGTDRAPP